MTQDSIERILVVDDDPRNIRLLEGIFRTAGYAVDKALSGAEALQRIHDWPPDLILLDVMMPGMSGHEVCTILKREERTRSIPLVLVTSLSSTEDKVQGLDLGADDFVSKPVNRLELLAKTRSLLRIKMLHDQLSRAKNELEAKNQELVRLEQLKESLVQMIVHDLKNPLTAMVGHLSLVLQTEPAASEKTRKRVGVALDSTRVMMRMILDLLDIGRLEENQIVLSRKNLSLAGLADATLQENGALIASSKLEVRREFDPRSGEVWADPDLMGRVIANLLSNAIKHTPEGGTITLGSESRRGGTVFFVRDTGEGIEAAHHHLIFEKFRQVEARKLGLKTDRGLGLTFCKMAVEAHGGRIWLESAPQKGSTFYVSLPGQEAQPQTPPSHEAPSLVSISGQERR